MGGKNGIVLTTLLRKLRHGVESPSVRIRGEDGVVTNTMGKKHDHGIYGHELDL